jgi:hypothetical protein
MRYYGIISIVQQVGQTGCFVCKRPDHKKAECPMLDLKCLKCKSRGHVAGGCTGAKRLFNFIAEDTANFIQQSEDNESKIPPQNQPTERSASSQTTSDPISTSNAVAATTNSTIIVSKEKRAKQKIQTLTQMSVVVVDTPNTSNKRIVARSNENTPSPQNKDPIDEDSYLGLDSSD